MNNGEKEQWEKLHGNKILTELGEVYDEVRDFKPIDEVREIIKNKDDTVNHPSHYTFGKIEVLDVIEDWKLDYHRGNAVKYIARAPHKGKYIEDLKKAVFYLNRKIKLLEAENE